MLKIQNAPLSVLNAPLILYDTFIEKVTCYGDKKFQEAWTGMHKHQLRRRRKHKRQTERVPLHIKTESADATTHIQYGHVNAGI